MKSVLCSVNHLHYYNKFCLFFLFQDDLLWNYLILMIKLINLMPTIDNGIGLLEHLKHPILFCLNCLKTERESTFKEIKFY